MMSKLKSKSISKSISTLLFIAIFPTSAMATTLEVTVTNLAAPGGFALTPLYTAFHNSSFDAFNVGDKASAGIESLAEVGNPADVITIQTDTHPASISGVIAANANGIPPIEAGESASMQFNIDGQVNPLFTFLSMILPSNDTFIGSDNAIQLFDNAGNFLGDKTINVTGSFIYDAGTEVNDASAMGGAAPFPGAPGGLDEDGVITAGQSLNDFAGLFLFGQELDINQINFLNDPENFAVARIQISVVPLPPAILLFGAALFGLGWLGRKHKTKIAIA